MRSAAKWAKRLPRPVFSKWVSLVAGIYLMVTSGSIYMFAVYSGDLKQILGYDTEQINLVGTLANAGGCPPPPLVHSMFLLDTLPFLLFMAC